MDENEVIEIIKAHINNQFPKECPACGRQYKTLAEYLQNTTHIGEPISYDAEDRSWKPKTPIGTMSYANCSCGSTLAITSSGMNLTTMWRLLLWAKTETKKRGITTRELLVILRQKIDQTILNYQNGDSQE